MTDKEALETLDSLKMRVGRSGGKTIFQTIVYEAFAHAYIALKEKIVNASIGGETVVLSVHEHEKLEKLTEFLYSEKVHYHIAVVSKGEGRRYTIFSVMIQSITKEQLYYIRDKLRIKIPEV